MDAAQKATVNDYLIVMRVIQPARIQDVKRMMPIILGLEMNEVLERTLDRIHEKLKNDKRIISVRRGTYILDAQGMKLTSRIMKERHLDNARLFLMKQQRKSYRKLAGWPS